ncbi:hypothetical protein JN01_0387 [Entomoplasma freundtii]|uniref:Uncharacterized protein n=1 Tax=Entomoplasma freundtii TaxID=74700 RepID=A0A2K8NTW7_9MOLU|nr:hypothetical protein [Entomoplasma freundtii]ATZ16201.1 hypothetical protein EFREU_v1c01740 [Entomoplasma freundtii]TDY56898.1 hypothetical protein JN01_0387 [Entomoplasma freundtii]
MNKAMSTTIDANGTQRGLDDYRILIEDEILLLKYEPEFQNIDLAGQIRRRWEGNNRDVALFNQWLTFKFATLVPSFVSLNEEQTNAVNETLILRFFTLSIVILKMREIEAQASEEHQALIIGNFSQKLKRIINTSVEMLREREFPNFILRLEQKNLPDFIESWFKDFKVVIQNFDKVLNLTKLEDILEEIYLVYEFVTDFLDYLDETEFEILEDEVQDINIILSWILYLHGILYNLLLVIEKVFDSEEQESNLELLPLKEILEEHDSRLEMMRLLSNELTN